MGATSVLNQRLCFWFMTPLMLDGVKVTSLGQPSSQAIGLVPDRTNYRICPIENQPERGEHLKQRMLAIGLDAYGVVYGQVAIAFWDHGILSLFGWVLPYLIGLTTHLLARCDLGVKPTQIAMCLP